MSETYLEELRRYLRFGGADEAALRALLPSARPHFPAIAQRFYERVREHDRAAQVMHGDQQLLRLEATLVDWLESLLGGPWDEGYYEKRSRIGRAHVRIQLPQRYMLTGMGVLQDELFALTESAFAGDADARTAAQRALTKVTALELAIMLETYRADTVAALQRFERAERELVSRRLAATEARYHAIVEGAPAAVFAIDAAGRLVLFNRRAEELTGCERAAVLGGDALASLWHPASRRAMAGAVADTLAGRAPAPFDTRLVTAGGAERWLRVHLTALEGPEGLIACGLGVDVTEERHLGERSRRAEGLAALGTLAAGLAHEIRNPLNAAQLQLALVERSLGRVGGGAGDRGLAAAALVREELARLGGLVSDFLLFARPAPLRLAVADLGATAAAVAALLSPDAAAAGVALEVATGEPVFAVFDDERVRQVVHNLVRNGIDAAGAGGRVIVRCERIGERALLEVADTGPGVTADVDVVQPFATTKEAGTGLGLPIVHRIATDHGGDLGWERQDGLTVFRVELPVDGPP